MGHVQRPKVIPGILNQNKRTQLVETVCFPSTLFPFCLRVMEEQLKTTQWWFLPIWWPEQWEQWTGLWWQAECSSLQWGLLNRHSGHLHAVRPLCDLRLGSSELRGRRSPFTLKFLLGHSLFSVGLLFLLNFFRISVEVRIRHDPPQVFTGDGATHTQNFPGWQSPHQTHQVSSLVAARDGNIHRAQKRVRVTLGSSGQVDMSL